MNDVHIVALALMLSALLCGCAGPGGGEVTPSTGTVPSDDPYYCVSDSGCEIKDVHNCCGYYPRCVNRDYVPDIGAVRERCEKEGISSVCGYPEISSCRCVGNRCESLRDGSVV